MNTLVLILSECSILGLVTDVIKSTHVMFATFYVIATEKLVVDWNCYELQINYWNFVDVDSCLVWGERRTNNCLRWAFCHLINSDCKCSCWSLAGNRIQFLAIFLQHLF